MQYHGVDAVEAPRRLPQRSSGQEPAIAETRLVHERDCRRRVQGPMLQTVVGDDDVDVWMQVEKQTSGGRTIGADHTGA